jgi:4-hydroxythreonine-4-phosphate dehydrogenase
VHKGVINDAGLPFTGHTEFLAERCGAEPGDDARRPRAAGGAGHHPPAAAEVSAAITPDG